MDSQIQTSNDANIYFEPEQHKRTLELI
jgi:nitrate reductase (NAD(P)H)